MADKSLSQLTPTATVSGSYMEISIPDGSGGWYSRKILHSNVTATLTAALAIINTYIAQATQTNKYKSQSANFTDVLGSDCKVESIDFIWVSGSPNVKVGLSSLANDIISGRNPISADPSENTLNKYLGTSTTLYFTITGGSVDVIINYRENYNA